jgi:hypothetical protein
MPKIENESYELKCDFCGKPTPPTRHYKAPTDDWIYLTCGVCDTTDRSPLIAPMVESDENRGV